jgi:hypothetical protein
MVTQPTPDLLAAFIILNAERVSIVKIQTDQTPYGEFFIDIKLPAALWPWG